MKIDKNFRPRRIPGLWKKEGSKIFVSSFNGEFEFEGVASLIWELCDGRKTIEEIEKNIEENYPNVPKETIEKDLENFLLKMEKDDLLILNYDPLFPHKKIYFLEMLKNNNESKI
ncbi:MAG: PqqD family protein [candidate division WOR-3 bacterium]